MSSDDNLRLPKDEKTRKTYGLSTAIAMIVGIVIGSGIFFKSDNILIATGGDVLVGCLLFCFAAVSIIFGSLSLAELAARTDEPGGLMNYAETFLSPSTGSAYGWFQTFMYLPTICVVVAWVGGVYTCQLFGLPESVEIEILIGAGYIIFFTLLNILSAKAAGLFQNASTVIKIIPLVIIGIMGFFTGDTQAVLSAAPAQASGATNWLFSIPAVAYSFDGWIVSTSIAHEIRHSKKNLPKALVISPIIILVLYLVYFVGISTLIGPREVMQMGDDHLYFAAGLLFGKVGQKIMSTLIVISVVGTVNGLIMGLSQMPYALALRNMIPMSELLKKTDKNEFPVSSAIFGMAICLLWMIVHFITLHYGLLNNSDVSEISIVCSYLLYIPLYYKVFKLYKKGEIGIFRGLFCPLLATAGSITIFCGGLQNSLFILYMAICLLSLIAGFHYGKKHESLPQIS